MLSKRYFDSTEPWATMNRRKRERRADGLDRSRRQGEEQAVPSRDPVNEAIFRLDRINAYIQGGGWTIPDEEVPGQPVGNGIEVVPLADIQAIFNGQLPNGYTKWNWEDE